ncbi:MAG: 2Fe-2S iron-sulfur cluster-binding protein [Planctomycetota bacterium]|jgi:2Fe-2S ferredoxin|nr:2Fe-2S iron-sulfur cluster-binding protein [Planctomycetota bacterium]
MASYRITFLPDNKSVEVDTDKIGAAHDGLDGSVLHLAELNHIEIDHACGGVTACSTCHIIVREGEKGFNPADEDEEDMLDNAPGLCLSSRLACQAVPTGECDVVVEIPDWNRNKVKEAH